jgi:glutathione S-transferase
VVDQAISDRDFLLGSEFDAADIMMGFSLQLVSNLKVLDDQYPNAQAYLDRLKSRDAFTRAMNA